MATDETVIVHPGDIIQATNRGPLHGHLLLVRETRRWGVGAVLRYPGSLGDDVETYHRFKPGEFAVVGAAFILPPELVEARRASIRTQRQVEQERGQ